MIRDIWTQGTDIIYNMRVINTDAVSYQSKTPENCTEIADRKNKRKYLNYCLHQCIHFTNFSPSVDELIGVKAETSLKRIAIHLAQKWK